MKRFNDGVKLRRRLGLHLREDPTDTPMEERLYAASAEAVILVTLQAQTVIDANPSAAKLLGSTRPALVGAGLTSLFTMNSRDAIAAGVTAAVAAGHTCTRWVCAAGGNSLLDLKLSLVRTGSESHLLIHIQESDLANASTLDPAPDSSVLNLLENSSDAFFVTDRSLRLVYANRAFAMMAGKVCSEALQGGSITQWLDLTQSDLDALAAQMLRRQCVQFLRTQWRRTANALRDVVLCAIAVPDGQTACWGFRVWDNGESAVSI
jgi:PAS domain-containing protein